MSVSGTLDKFNPHLIVIFYCLSGYKAVDKKPKPDANHVECSFDNQPGPGQYCKVLAEELMTGPCTLENHYGYDKGKPCVIIKLNKVGQIFNIFSLNMPLRMVQVSNTPLQCGRSSRLLGELYKNGFDSSGKGGTGAVLYPFLPLKQTNMPIRHFCSNVFIGKQDTVVDIDTKTLRNDLIHNKDITYTVKI